MDRRIRRLGIGLVVLFALLFAQLSYVQVIAADDIKAQPANARRQIIAEYRVERGPILSADGELLAHSVRNQERRSELLFRRVYPDGRSTPASPGTTRASTGAPSSSRRPTRSCRATRPSSRCRRSPT